MKQEDEEGEEGSTEGLWRGAETTSPTQIFPSEPFQSLQESPSSTSPQPTASLLPYLCLRCWKGVWVLPE